MTKLSGPKPYNLTIEGWQHFSSGPTLDDMEEQKAHLEAHHPKHTFEIRNYMACFEEMDANTRTVIRWRQEEGYSLWCKPPLH